MDRQHPGTDLGSCLQGETAVVSVISFPWWMWLYIESVEQKPNLLIFELMRDYFQVCTKNTLIGNTVGTH